VNGHSWCFVRSLADESDCTRERGKGPFFGLWSSQLLLVRRTGQGEIDWSWREWEEARLAKEDEGKCEDVI
jgi:hypothetical protein